MGDSMKKIYLLAAVVALGMAQPAWAQGAGASYYLEELTWQEVAARMTTGTNTIIIPTGGTEQNGPAIAIGKHNWVVGYTSGAIAKALGNALAAPVIGYVPEGMINPPQGHMLFPGTISVSEKVFAGVLEDTARSFKQHGFHYIFFLGDSGGNQDAQAAVAEKLTKEWAADKVVVASLDKYYADSDAAAYVKGLKMGGTEVQAHGGFMDASEAMAAHKGSVRAERLARYTQKDFTTTGAMGDATGASEVYGQKLLDMKVAAGVGQIRKLMAEKP